jgi:hypothetical protein
MANGHVLVVRIFRHRPASHFFDRTSWTIAREHRLRVDIAGVIEVDYLLETEQVAVVHVGLHEPRIGHFTRVADRGGLELALKEGQMLSPRKIGRSAVVTIEEQADSFVGETGTQGIAGESNLIGGVFGVKL